MCENIIRNTHTQVTTEMTAHAQDPRGFGDILFILAAVDVLVPSERCRIICVCAVPSHLQQA